MKKVGIVMVVYLYYVSFGMLSPSYSVETAVRPANTNRLEKAKADTNKVEGVSDTNKETQVTPPPTPVPQGITIRDEKDRVIAIAYPTVGNVFYDNGVTPDQVVLYLMKIIDQRDMEAQALNERAINQINLMGQRLANQQQGVNQTLMYVNAIQQLWTPPAPPAPEVKPVEPPKEPVKKESGIKKFFSGKGSK